MLQFWIPRTPQFEEAMFNSMRLPFFGRGFDEETERVTVDILKTLARFEDIGDLQTETVSSILVNRALRQTIASERDEEEKIKLVRDALIQRHRETERELQQISQEAERLKKEARDKEEQLDEAIKTKDQAIKTKDLKEQALASKILQLEERARSEKEALESRIVQLEAGLRTKAIEEQDRKDREESKKAHKNFVLKWILPPLIVLLGAGLIISYAIVNFTDLKFGRVLATVAIIGLLAQSILVDRFGSKNGFVRSWSFFIAFQRVKNWVWGVLILGLVIGVLGNALFDWIKNQLVTF